MPTRRGKFSVGKVDIISLLGVVFLVASVGVITATTANINIKQIFSSFAGGRCIDNAHCVAGMINAKNSAPGAVYQNPVSGATYNYDSTTGTYSDTSGNTYSLDSSGQLQTVATITDLETYASVTNSSTLKGSGSCTTAVAGGNCSLDNEIVQLCQSKGSSVGFSGSCSLNTHDFAVAYLKAQGVDTATAKSPVDSSKSINDTYQAQRDQAANQSMYVDAATHVATGLGIVGSTTNSSGTYSGDIQTIRDLCTSSGGSNCDTAAGLQSFSLSVLQQVDTSNNNGSTGYLSIAKQTNNQTIFDTATDSGNQDQINQAKELCTQSGIANCSTSSDLFSFGMAYLKANNNDLYTKLNDCTSQANHSWQGGSCVASASIQPQTAQAPAPQPAAPTTQSPAAPTATVPLTTNPKSPLTPTTTQTNTQSNISVSDVTKIIALSILSEYGIDLNQIGTALNNVTATQQQIATQNPNANYLQRTLNYQNIVQSIQAGEVVTNQLNPIKLLLPGPQSSVITNAVENLPVIGINTLGSTAQAIAIETANPNRTLQSDIVYGAADIMNLVATPQVVNSANRLFHQMGMTPEEAQVYRSQSIDGYLARAGDAFTVGLTAVTTGDIVGGSLGTQGFVQAVKNPSSIPQAVKNLIPDISSEISNSEIASSLKTIVSQSLAGNSAGAGSSAGTSGASTTTQTVSDATSALASSKTTSGGMLFAPAEGLTSANQPTQFGESLVWGNDWEKRILSQSPLSSPTIENIGGRTIQGNTYDELLNIVQTRMSDTNEDAVTAVTNVIHDLRPVTGSASQDVSQQLAYQIQNPDALSALAICKDKLNCLELPVLEKQLLSDLGAENPQIIIGFGGRTGLNNGFEHGAVMANGQVIGYYAPHPVPVANFQRYATAMNWGDFGLNNIDQQVAASEIAGTENVVTGTTARPGLLTQAQDWWTQNVVDENGVFLPKLYGPKTVTEPIPLTNNNVPNIIFETNGRVVNGVANEPTLSINGTEYPVSSVTDAEQTIGRVTGRIAKIDPNSGVVKLGAENSAGAAASEPAPTIPIVDNGTPIQTLSPQTEVLRPNNSPVRIISKINEGGQSNIYSAVAEDGTRVTIKVPATTQDIERIQGSGNILNKMVSVLSDSEDPTLAENINGPVKFIKLTPDSEPTALELPSLSGKQHTYFTPEEVTRLKKIAQILDDNEVYRGDFFPDNLLDKDKTFVVADAVDQNLEVVAHRLDAEAFPEDWRVPRNLNRDVILDPYRDPVSKKITSYWRFNVPQNNTEAVNEMFELFPNLTDKTAAESAGQISADEAKQFFYEPKGATTTPQGQNVPDSFSSDITNLNDVIANNSNLSNTEIYKLILSSPNISTPAKITIGVVNLTAVSAYAFLGSALFTKTAITDIPNIVHDIQNFWQGLPFNKKALVPSSQAPENAAETGQSSASIAPTPLQDNSSKYTLTVIDASGQNILSLPDSGTIQSGNLTITTQDGKQIKLILPNSGVPYSVKDIKTIANLIQNLGGLGRYFPNSITLIEEPGKHMSLPYLIDAPCAENGGPCDIRLTIDNSKMTPTDIATALAATLKYGGGNYGQFWYNDLQWEYYYTFYAGRGGEAGNYSLYDPNTVFPDKTPLVGNSMSTATSDMADAIARYLTNPQQLKEQDPARYAFIDAAYKGYNPSDIRLVKTNGTFDASGVGTTAVIQNNQDSAKSQLSYLNSITWDKIDWSNYKDNYSLDQFKNIIQSASDKSGIPVSIIVAVIERESSGFPNQTTNMIDGGHANGLMQIRGGSFDPATNIQQGTDLLKAIYNDPTLGNGNWRDSVALYYGGDWNTLLTGDLNGKALNPTPFGYVDGLLTKAGIDPNVLKTADTISAEKTKSTGGTNNSTSGNTVHDANLSTNNSAAQNNQNFFQNVGSFASNTVQNISTTVGGIYSSVFGSKTTTSLAGPEETVNQTTGQVVQNTTASKAGLGNTLQSWGSSISSFVSNTYQGASNFVSGIISGNKVTTNLVGPEEAVQTSTTQTTSAATSLTAQNTTQSVSGTVNLTANTAAAQTEQSKSTQNLGSAFLSFASKTSLTISKTFDTIYNSVSSIFGGNKTTTSLVGPEEVVQNSNTTTVTLNGNSQNGITQGAPAELVVNSNSQNTSETNNLAAASFSNSLSNTSLFMQKSKGYSLIDGNTYGGNWTQWGCGPSTSYNISQILCAKGVQSQCGITMSDVLGNYLWTSVGSDGGGVLLDLRRNGLPADSVTYGENNRILDATELQSHDGIFVYDGSVDDVPHLAAFDCKSGSCYSIDSYFSDGKPVPCTVTSSSNIKCGDSNYYVGTTGGSPAALLPVKTPQE